MVHRLFKHLRSMGVVFEHVKTRTRWREQHQVARLRELLRRTHRLRQALHTDHGFPQGFEHVLDLGRIFAHQNHRLHVLLNRTEQWREILSLAHSTQITTKGPSCPNAFKAAQVAPTLVPLLSSTYWTPSKTRMV